ncbi:hypothetical protein CEXT_777781 [Caerostris extrusa]|uniref:Uncharacterized protein n=1 Tax=Caerostris extrusa TaxID=172846 RepID=A0AAV4WZU5_CAEEX|nr:hypothetical protein CEXT_777781 [Caerostris extrusa]
MADMFAIYDLSCKHLAPVMVIILRPRVHLQLDPRSLVSEISMCKSQRRIFRIFIVSFVSKNVFQELDDDFEMKWLMLPLWVFTFLLKEW